MAQVGSNVTDVAVGANVLGITRFGAYATHVVVPPRQIFRVPLGWTHAQAAGFPTVFLTAYHALFQMRACSPRNDSAYSFGAFGSVGVFRLFSGMAGNVIVA